MYILYCHQTYGIHALKIVPKDNGHIHYDTIHRILTLRARWVVFLPSRRCHFCKKTPRLSQQTGVPSLREETTRARAPKLYRPLQHRCTTGARAPKLFFITLIYESVQELIILQIA